MANTPLTAEYLIRHQMSAMAWGMAALCAWVVILSVHTIDCRPPSAPYQQNNSETATAHLPTAAMRP